MKTTAFANSLLLLQYNNTNIANVGDATGLRGSSTAGSFYLSLHTAWPGLAGDQTTSETSYSGYARVAVARTSGGFTVSSNTVSLTANADFATAAAGATGTLYFWALGTASSGSDSIVDMGGIGGTPVPCSMIASTDVITSAGLIAQSPTLSNNDPVVFWAQGGSVPAGLTAGTVYFAKSISGNTFSVSATSGGSTIDITANGECYIQRLTPITLAENVIPRLTTGTTIKEV